MYKSQSCQEVDEFSELEDNLVEEEEEEEEYREGDETECVQQEVNSVEGTDRTNNTSNTTEDTVPPLYSRDGNTWATPGQCPPVHPFTAHIGPTTTIPDSPLDAFLLTFTPDLIALIVRESNKYAKEVMGEDITDVELKAYLGFCILMSIAHIPVLEDYWKRDPVLQYAPIADLISRDRFRDISRYLHFADNSSLIPHGIPGHDCLGKVLPILTHLCQRFAALYDPRRESSIDEAMIKFQGRSSLKQYMPIKPIKRGIKVWVLADSINGYFSQLEVYTGKQPDQVETGLESRVFRSLTADFRGTHHLIVFDNFFMQYRLMEDLLEDGLYGCGTARKG